MTTTKKTCECYATSQGIKISDPKTLAEAKNSGPDAAKKSNKK